MKKKVSTTCPCCGYVYSREYLFSINKTFIGSKILEGDKEFQKFHLLSEDFNVSFVACPNCGVLLLASKVES